MLFETPKNLESKITRKIMRDLDPSWQSVHTRIGLSAVVGGLLSLFICGQFGMGITDFAEAFSAKVHANMGAINCAVICGTLYAIFPVVILRFILCRPMQFKVLLRRHAISVAAWYGGFGTLMAYFGHHGNGALELVFWVLAALVTTNIFAFLFNSLAPYWSMNDDIARRLDF